MSSLEGGENTKGRRYGTFEGVFVPTLLTILGVILFLREGWVVGNAGLVGGALIVLLSFAITAATGLSMSSVVTNIRIGAGGAYAIISRSLGLEVGGSVGIPLYLSQTLAVSMYVFGFREGWQNVFPDHPALLVDVAVFGVLLAIAWVSASFAFRVQYVILALIVAALASVAVAAAQGSMQFEPQLWGEFPGDPEEGFGGTSFWIVFAVFFPAATGIMAGANLSGELKDPRRSIPVGTMSAIALSLVIYLAAAYWVARSARPDELVSNFTVMIDLAAWRPAVVAGLLGATFSSGLSSLVGAPRILQALGDHEILPGGRWFSKTSRGGEPRNAIIVTATIVLFGLLLRDLNAIAPLITMFFLITYTMINLVVLIEQGLGLVSFRPLFRIPRAIPFLGTVGCLFAMFIVNPAFALVAVVIVFGFYGYLIRRHLTAPFGDVRSGLFVAVAEWAAKRVTRLEGTLERAWKPNLLIPIEDAGELRGMFRLIHDIAYPKGSVKLMGLTADHDDLRFAESLERSADAFRDEGVFATWTTLETPDFGLGVVAAMDALSGAYFRPNVLLVEGPTDPGRANDLDLILDRAVDDHLGVLLFANHPQAGLGRRHWLNLWFPDLGPGWAPGDEDVGLDLGILITYKLMLNWDGRVRLLTATSAAEDKPKARSYLEALADLTRLPGAEVYALEGAVAHVVDHAPQADLNVFRLPTPIDFEFMQNLVGRTGSACLFARDSGEESASA